MSKLSVALAGFSLSNPVQSLETGLHNLATAYMKPTDAAAMEPETTNAINGAVAFALKFFKIYAFAKVETVLKEFLTQLAAKKPNLAPEINAILTKLPA